MGIPVFGVDRKIIQMQIWKIDYAAIVEFWPEILPPDFNAKKLGFWEFGPILEGWGVSRAQTGF